jgi:nitrate reductase gamma subunit
VTAVFAILLYGAVAVMVVGLAVKIRRYATVPAPLKIPLTPAPTSVAGVVARLAREVLLFASLFRSNKWIWLFGWMFHVALLLVLLAHLRYFTEPVWLWVVWLQPFGKYAAFALIIGLGGLWLRRLTAERVRYITAPSDHLMLLLLIAIAASGMTMRFLAPIDIVALKGFALGLTRASWLPLPEDPVLMLHLALVAVLLIAFPFSKLLHAPGVFFSPSRTQIDDARDRRYRP